ncbi:WD40 repeat-like protein [Zopfia rhizophila CBS 207.26]|uniref:WD40 repeat-like protein n=1 Tax=Zopfia rhizophila CBS 207.26 TaxID=1314779 RepID=A0A6A6E9N5_9PEZI|nr:WD40 repeat-like protein [Zopfia rhizophila CBS 207.26]
MAHPIPSLPPSTPSIPVQLPPLFSLDSNLYELDQESESADGDHANLQDTTAFLDVSTFFRHYLRRPRGDISLYLEELHQPDVITKSDLDDNEYDIQGINWNLLNMTREDVRMKRSIFEATRMRAKVKARRQWSKLMPNTANLFSFRRMNTTHRVDIPHFQLRNLLVSTSRSDIYYATGDQVLRTDALGASADCIMDLTRARSEGHKFLITTLNALDDVLIAGGFYGEYALTNLSSTYGTRSTVGRVASANNGITNQVHIFNSRSNYTPQAAFCSNDKRLRILDCETNAFTHSFLYSNPVNCSATSPNGRMRVVVGDFHETLITNAETGQAFETLRAHDDDVFACAWADDGIHVATSAQDCRIAVWDARNWSHPLSVIESELSIPRCLRFSPVGSGPRVLISAEADDYVNVIDAVNFDTRHVLDFFGRTAGISMTPDGSSLFVANSDPNFGGIMEFERCQFGEQYGRSQMSRWGSESYEQSFLGGEPPFDWAVDEDMDDDVRVVCGWHERQRRGLELGSLVV